VAVRVLLLAVATVLGCIACGSGSPSPTPIGLVEVRVLLARNGITTLSAVSGDSACPAQSLQDNALHLTVTTATDPAPRDLFLYLFRQRYFAGTAAAMDACVADYAASAGEARVERIDSTPYRAIGIGWSGELRRALESALREAGR